MGWLDNYGNQGKLGRSAHITPATEYAQLEKIPFFLVYITPPNLQNCLENSFLQVIASY